MLCLCYIYIYIFLHWLKKENIKLFTFLKTIKNNNREMESKPTWFLNKERNEEEN